MTYKQDMEHQERILGLQKEIADLKSRLGPVGSGATPCSSLEKGSYVIATKFHDGDPNDHWCVGYYRGMLPKSGGDRYEVVGGDGQLFRGNGFRRCEKISKERGEWLLKNARDIQWSGKSLWYFARCSMTR